MACDHEFRITRKRANTISTSSVEWYYGFVGLCGLKFTIFVLCIVVNAAKPTLRSKINSTARRGHFAAVNTKFKNAKIFNSSHSLCGQRVNNSRKKNTISGISSRYRLGLSEINA